MMHRSLLAVGAAMLCCSCGTEPLARLPAQIPSAAGTAMSPHGEPVRRFHVSGHSLTARPMPEYLAAMLGTGQEPAQWDENHVAGSSLRQRPAEFSPGNHDLLLVTEQHGLLGSMTWHDTRGQLRDLRRAFQAANPSAAVFFYVPWLAVDDMAAPERWIAYERAATPVWWCVVDAANRREAGEEERGSPVQIVPVNLALAQWVERFGAGGMFEDDVHLTPQAKYYAALVVYFSVAGFGAAREVSSLAALGPSGLEPDMALRMIEAARQFVAGWQGQVAHLTAAQCNQFLDATFREDYWNYFRRTQLGHLPAPLAWWRSWRLARSTAADRFEE